MLFYSLCQHACEMPSPSTTAANPTTVMKEMVDSWVHLVLAVSTFTDKQQQEACVCISLGRGVNLFNPLAFASLGKVFTATNQASPSLLLLNRP